MLTDDRIPNAAYFNTSMQYASLMSLSVQQPIRFKHYGIDDKIWLWISNFLKQRVVVDGIQSDLVTVDSGVPQGTVLGLILFLLHINNLPSVISSKVRFFAEDCLVYREIKNRQDQIALQKDLNFLENWGSKWE